MAEFILALTGYIGLLIIVIVILLIIKDGSS